MRADINMKVNGSDFQSVLMAASNTGVGRAGDVIVRYIKDSFVKTSWFNPSPAGGPPGTVTGRLRNSIQKTPPANGTTIVGTNEKYARIQEYGGTIRPTTKQYLTVPTNVDAAKLRARHQSLRDVKGLRFATMFGKKFLIKGPKKRPRIMFVLVRSVTLPARPYLRPVTTNQAARDRIRKAFISGFRFEIRQAFKAAAAAGAPAA